MIPELWPLVYRHCRLFTEACFEIDLKFKKAFMKSMVLPSYLHKLQQCISMFPAAIIVIVISIFASK